VDQVGCHSLICCECGISNNKVIC